MKNKIIIPIILGFFIINCVSAINIVAGETYRQHLDGTYSYYEITGNSTPIEIDVYQEGSYAYITPDKYMKDEDFTITFYEEEDDDDDDDDDSSSSSSSSSYDGITIQGIYILYVSQGQMFKFQLDGKHKLTAIEVDNNSIYLKIESEIKYVNIMTNEKSKIDLDNDGYYDLEIILLDITGTKAKISLEGINEKVVDTPVTQETINNEEDTINLVQENTQESTPSDIPEDTIQKNNNALKILILLGLLIIIVIIIIIMFNKKEVNEIE